MKTVTLTEHELETSDNKMDTLTMARQERETNGPWEVEISYAGEADLHRHLDGCDKNPGHLKFVPSDKFNVGHLPSGCQDRLIVDVIRALSHLTVRVSVKYVSEGRPDFFPGSDKPYPCYRNRGRDMMRVGTGWVWDVAIYPNKYSSNNKTTCKCKQCLNSSTPKTEFAYIHILTAAHVVCDDLEAANTTCHLFFDRGGTPDVCDGVIALSGMSCVVSKIDGDWCAMVHVTHDLDLTSRLDKMVGHLYSLEDKVQARYDPREYRFHKHNKRKTSSELDHLQKLTIIVSHPHGCSKQVSVGYCADTVERVNVNNTQFTYTTATCPGSSGAPVCVMREGMRNLNPSHVHCGNCDGNKDMNFSCWRQLLK